MSIIIAPNRFSANPTPLKSMLPEFSADHRWLLSAAAESWLSRAAEELAVSHVTPKFIQKLRIDLGVERTRLVVEQAQLRQRAVEKFSQADQLFFTSKGLEQATDEVIARYKANRFSLAGHRIDFCCGIGGDAMSLARDGEILLVDRDPLILAYAMENVRRVGGHANSYCGDVADVTLNEQQLWHIDPDRRPQGERISCVDSGEPNLATLEQMLTKSPNAAMKLSPAAALPENWQEQVHAEWIETRSECRQLVAWFGANQHLTEARTATLLNIAGCATSFQGSVDANLPVTGAAETYLYDPAPCLRAAQLVPAWCTAYGLQAVSRCSLYLTSERIVASPLHGVFQLLDELPLDIPQMKAYCRTQGIGRLEIKQRGVGITPEKLRPQLKLQGDEAAVLMLTEIGNRNRALFCRRVETGS